MIKFLAIDMDGTLLDPSQRSARKIKELPKNAWIEE